MKRKHRFIVGSIVILLLYAANHAEFHFRKKPARRAASSHQSAVFVRTEDTLIGHSSIGIAEDELPDTAGKSFLRFSTLGDWFFDKKTPSACPDEIKSLSGKNSTIVGFMYPLESGDKLKSFCLLRSTQTCCYGPKPEYNQYVLVEMPEPVKFERLMPVIVEGKFIVDPKPDEGYIYRMEGTSVHPAAEEDPEIDGKQAAQKAHLPLFDFSFLESMKSSEKPNPFPSQLPFVDGDIIVVEGFFLNETKDNPPRLMVGKYWWDGVAKGMPPTLFNAVMVTPRDRQEIPSRWKQKVVLTGVLHLTKDRSEWKTKGIVSIQDAVKGAPGEGKSQLFLEPGPILSIPEEIVILIVFLGISLFRFFFRREEVDI